MGFANFNIPAALLEKTRQLARVKTKRAAIVVALENYIDCKRIERLMALQGKMNLHWTKQSLKKYRG